MSNEKTSPLGNALIQIAIEFINLPVDQLDAAINEAMKQLGESTGADRFYVFAYDWEKKTGSNTHEWCAPGIEAQIQTLQNFPLEAFADWIEWHKDGKVHIINDVATLPEDSNLRKLLEAQSVLSLSAAPIMYGGICLGFVGMDWVRSHKSFSEEDKSLLQLFAEMLANVRNRLAAIKELENTKDQLRASEERYRSLLESDDGAIIVYEPDGKINFINHAAAEYFGKSRETIYGRSIRDVFPAEEAAAIAAEIQQVMQTNKGIIVERAVELSVGRRWFRASMQPVRNAWGAPYAALMHATDITDKKNAQEELLRNEERYHSLVESTDSAIVMYDHEGRVLYLNSIAAQPYGKSTEELIGTNVRQLFPPDQAESILRDIAAVMSSGQGKVLDTAVDLAGQRRYYRTSVQPVHDGDHRIYAVMMHASDLTPRKEAELKLALSEQKYRKLFVDSPEAYLIMLDGIFVECNRASEKLVGGSRTDILGKSPTEFSPEFQPNGRRSSEYAKELIAEAWQKKELAFEWVHLRVDGTPFTALVNLTVLEYDDAPVLLVTWRDITERKKLFDDLQLYQQRYSQALAHSRAVVWETDLEGKFTYMSPVSKAVFGYEPSEIEGKMFFYNFHPADVRDYYRKRGFEIMQAAEPTERLDNPIVCKDGQVIWVSTIGVSLFDAAGKRTGYRCVDFDITDRHAAEQQTLLFREVLKQANYGAAISALDGKLLFLNEAFAAMHGYTVDELTGRDLSIFHSPEQLQIVGETIKEMMQTGEFSTREIWHQYRDGSVFPTLMSGVVIKDEAGKPAYISATALDITDLKAKEAEIQKLMTAIEQSPVALVITDLEAHIEYVSPAFTQITGYKKEEVIGKHTRLLKSGLNPTEMYSELWQTITSGKTWHAEWTNKKKNGEIYPERVSILPIYDHRGKVCNYLAIKQDISDRRQAEEARIAREAADSANRMKSLFLANMSHEIRTPLNAVIGFAQILQRDKSLSDKQSQQVATILRSGEHLLSLINDILDLSKIEAGRITLKESGFSLKNLLNDVRVMFSLRAEEKRLSLSVEHDDAVPEFISADEAKIRQILINIVGNAMKFTDAGSIALRVRSQARMPEEANDARKTELIMSVADTGPGIATSEQELIFNAFQQSAAQAQKAGGTGLGLTISRRLAELMGGTLTVESELGKGSTFTLRIPVIAATHARQKESPSAYAQVTGLAEGMPKIRILVADDVSANNELIRDMLEPLGFEVRTVQNGREAVEQFQVWKPDAILMDLRMPLMDGFDATRAIRATEAGKSLPIFAVTASTFEDDIRLQTEGFTGYVRKPFTLSRLLGEFAHHLKVQYRQAAASAEEPETPAASAAGLNAGSLPRELRANICSAIQAGNSVRLKALLTEIEPIDGRLHAHAKRLAQQFDYDALLRLFAD
ncbi:MAG: PAS domain S-box protein [Spirochaetota bacterium]